MKYAAAIAMMVCAITVHAQSLQDQFPPTSMSKNPTGKDASRSHEMVENDNHGIHKAMVEHTACYGSCPVYSVSITKNGDVEYIGIRNVPFIGKRKGKLDKWYVRNLFQFINDSNYFAFQNSFSRPVTDHAYVYTQVVKVSGESKIILNYANSAPTIIWAIEETIDATAMKAVWDDVKTRP